MNKRQLYKMKRYKEKRNCKLAQLKQRDLESKESKSKLIVFSIAGLILACLIGIVVNFTLLKDLNSSIETLMQFMMLLFQ